MPKRRVCVILLLLLLAAPAALALYTLYDNRNYGLISFMMILLALTPFLLRYEHKKPPAREWIPLVVMAALASVGRIAFAPAPHFKPVSAIVIVTAMVFGPEAGFLTGAMAALSSNLFFGQGPWTPWQMFAWGIIGFLAGILAKHGRLKKKWQLVAYGLFSGFLYGWILNIWAASAMMMAQMSWEAFFYLYVSSFPLDLVHGASTALFLLLIADSWGAKLRRVQLKFGILCGQDASPLK